MERWEKILPLSLLSLLAGKSLLVGTSVSEMGMSLGLVALVSINSILEKHKKIQEIKNVVNEQNKVISKMAEELVEVRNTISTLKLQQSMRKLG